MAARAKASGMRPRLPVFNWAIASGVQVFDEPGAAPIVVIDAPAGNDVDVGQKTGAPVAASEQYLRPLAAAPDEHQSGGVHRARDPAFGRVQRACVPPVRA